MFTPKKIEYLFIIFCTFTLHVWISIFKGGKWCQPHGPPCSTNGPTYSYWAVVEWQSPGHKRAPRFERDPRMFAHAAIFSSTSFLPRGKLRDCTATMSKQAKWDEGEIGGPGQSQLGLALFVG